MTSQKTVISPEVPRKTTTLFHVQLEYLAMPGMAKKSENF